MKAVRRRDARVAPARFNFALPRLAAFAAATRMREEPDPHVVLVIDRNQNAVESYAMAAWIVFSVSTYIAAALSPHIGVPAAAVAGLPLTLMLFQFAVVAGGALVAPLSALFRQDKTRWNSALQLTIFAAWSLWMATTESWVRYVAIFGLGLLILNAVAAVIAALLRSRIRAVDSARGVAA